MESGHHAAEHRTFSRHPAWFADPGGDRQPALAAEVGDAGVATGPARPVRPGDVPATARTNRPQVAGRPAPAGRGAHRPYAGVDRRLRLCGCLFGLGLFGIVGPGEADGDSVQDQPVGPFRAAVLPQGPLHYAGESLGGREHLLRPACPG